MNACRAGFVANWEKDVASCTKKGEFMIRTIEAVIDENGNVRLLEPVRLPSARRAFVTIMEEGATAHSETALLSRPP